MLDSTMNPRAAADLELTYFLAENEQVPQWNGPTLTISQVIKFVMSLDPKAEIGAILITEK